MNLLIIEDEKPLADLLVRLFEPVSRSCTIARKFSEALELMEKNKFDVVTLDLNLPDTRDVGTLQRIKELRQHNPDVIIIVYTGLDSPQLEADALRYGADGFISKATTATVQGGVIASFHAIFRNLLKQPMRYKQSIALLERVISKIASTYQITTPNPCCS